MRAIVLDGNHVSLRRDDPQPVPGNGEVMVRVLCAGICETRTADIVLKTTLAGRQQMPWAPIVIDEVTIVGSRCGPFDRALAALEAGEVSVLP